MLKLDLLFPFRGQKNRELILPIFQLSISDSSFLERGDYLTRTDCQLWFLFSVSRRLSGEGRTNYQERF
jgi:hypothetical protein